MCASTMSSTKTYDSLDRRANETFGGRVVRKDLVRQVKVGANVPVYVLEFLLGKYCASDDPEAIQTGLQVVNETLAENFVRPDEAEKSKAAAQAEGPAPADRQGRRSPGGKRGQVLGRASELRRQVRPRSRGRRLPLRAASPRRRVVPARSALQRRRGRGAQAPLLHRALKPIQVAAFSMDEYAAGRARSSAATNGSI